MNKKKLFRLYKEEGLAMRRRRGRKRATGTRAPVAQRAQPALEPGLRGRRLLLGPALQDPGILCIVDDPTREALALVVNTSISGHRMARGLDALITRRGRPALIVR